MASILSRPVAITGLQGQVEADGPSQCGSGCFMGYFLILTNLHW